MVAVERNQFRIVAEIEFGGEIPYIVDFKNVECRFRSTDYCRCGGSEGVVGEIDGIQFGEWCKVERLQLVVRQVEHFQIGAFVEFGACDVCTCHHEQV